MLYTPDQIYNDSLKEKLLKELENGFGPINWPTGIAVEKEL